MPSGTWKMSRRGLMPQVSSQPGPLSRREADTPLQRQRQWQPHQSIDGMGAEIPTATVRELRRPNLKIAGEQVEFIDFRLGSQGLEAVSFDLGLGLWHQRSKKFVRHFEQRLGPPSKRRGETFAFWELPKVVVG